MKRIILALLLFVSFTASAQFSIMTQYGVLKDSSILLFNTNAAISGKQASLNGTGLVRMAGTTVSYDASVYLIANQAVTVTATGDATGTSTSSGTAPSLPLVLATVNSNVGTFSIATVTVNAKGLVTAVTSGAAAASNKYGEEATGSASSTITLTYTALTGTLRLFKNGVRLPSAKFSLSGSTITLTDSRATTDTFQSDYNY